MAKIDDFDWYKREHEGETKKLYIVREGDHTYKRHAYSPYDAIERVAYQYGWGDLHNVWYDAETRGELWCKAEVSWGGETPRYLMAEIANAY